jgi:hypothetical protein
MKLVVFNEGGRVCVVHPAEPISSHSECVKLGEEVVPTGLPFGILESTELPDRGERDFWKVDNTELNDGVGL